MPLATLETCLKLINENIDVSIVAALAQVLTYSKSAIVRCEFDDIHLFRQLWHKARGVIVLLVFKVYPPFIKMYLYTYTAGVR